MSRTTFVAMLALISLLTAAVSTAQADGDGHVNFLIGQKVLDEDDWAPIDKQGEFGVVMSFGRSEWPVHIAVDVLVSADEQESFDPFIGEFIFTGVTSEVAVGVRKIWTKGATHPYVGGGMAVVAAAVELETTFGDADADGSALGVWGGGGVFWRLGQRFNLGFDVRWSDAEVDLAMDEWDATFNDAKAGGFHYGLTLGFGW